MTDQPGSSPDIRIESDSMGDVEVPADRYWGAQTQRSLQNFRVGSERMPPVLVRAHGGAECLDRRPVPIPTY